MVTQYCKLKSRCYCEVFLPKVQLEIAIKLRRLVTRDLRLSYIVPFAKLCGETTKHSAWTFEPLGKKARTIQGACCLYPTISDQDSFLSNCRKYGDQISGLNGKTT